MPPAIQFHGGPTVSSNGVDISGVLTVGYASVPPSLAAGAGTILVSNNVSAGNAVSAREYEMATNAYGAPTLTTNLNGSGSQMLDAYANDSGGQIIWTVPATGPGAGTADFTVNYSRPRLTPGHPVLCNAGSSGLSATVQFYVTNCTTSGFQVTSPSQVNAGSIIRLNYWVAP